MPQVYIEDIAKAMGQDPSKLSALETRKYCILIDWALALHSKSEYAPFFQSIELKDEEVQKIISGIVKGISENKFKMLDTQKPDSDQMEDTFLELCPYLGFKEVTVDDLDPGFIGDYDNIIKRKGLMHTKSLVYQPRFNKDDSEALKANSQLKELYDKLKASKVFSANLHTFFDETDEKLVGVNSLQSLSPNKKAAASQAAELTVFYLEMIKELKAIEKKQNVPCSEVDIKALIDNLRPWVSKISSSTSNQIEVLQINRLLRDIMPADKKNNLRPKIAEALSQLLIDHKELRKFKALQDLSKDESIDRVIWIGPQDLADQEVMRTIDMVLTNHAKEKIIVTFDIKDIEKVNERNKAFDKKFTLHAVGHGTVINTNQFNANIGTFRGDSVLVGEKLANLVNDCSEIDHLRITGCFTGLMRDDADLQALREKEHIKVTAGKEHRRTLTLVTDDNMNESNSPFFAKTVAVNCWNKIDKSKRQISMTVSPGIIEPDEEYGRMMWKPSPNTKSEHLGIKEVRVTTTGGPKNKLKL